MSNHDAQTSDDAAAGVALDVLDRLIPAFARAILSDIDKHAKVGDLIRMIELHRKLAPMPQEQKRLWQMLEEIRREVLDRPGRNRAAPTASALKAGHRPDHRSSSQ